MAEGATIGQARLAVIDLVTGDPPIRNEDGAISAVLNGEIYNFLDLREDLLTRGHRFTTRCDTEVLAHLAEDLDPVEMTRRLNGMFAFAIYDKARRRLVLGRDRMGKKPLYYWHRKGTFVFGSEPKSVLAHTGVERKLNLAVLPAYLTLGYAPTPHTFYEGLMTLPPAHVLILREGHEPELHPYWSSPLSAASWSTPIREPTIEEASSRVRSLLDAAVRRRMISDVPLGAFLSGGIDSSAVVALMARHSERPVKTFTIGFDDHVYDERPFAAMVAKKYKTDHTEFVVKPNASDLIEQLVEHHDGPFGDSSALPTYLLSQFTRNNVTVALCGDGGDEIFAGYERFAAALLLERLHRLPQSVGSTAERVARLASRYLTGRLVTRSARMLAERNSSASEAFFRWMNVLPPPWTERLLPARGSIDPGSAFYREFDPGSAFYREFDPGSAFYRELSTTAPEASLLQRLQQANIFTYLLDDLLVKVDRMSMAHGLEVRSPFLDVDLATYALTLPDSLKIRGLTLKRVLKHASADLLPPAVVHRAKRGFAVPLNRWFREELRLYVQGALTAPSASLRRYLDPGAIDSLVAEHLAGRADHGHGIWALLSLELFLRKEGW